VSARGGRRDFSAVTVLAHSFRLLARQAGMLIPLALLLLGLPSWMLVSRIETFAYEWADLGQLLWPERAYREPVVAFLLVDWISPLAFQALVAFALHRCLDGKPARWGASLAEGARRLVHAVAAGLAVLLVLIIPFVIMALWVRARGSPMDAPPILFLGLAYCAFLAPSTYVTVQAAVAEGAGPIRALGRSSSLTLGERWHVLAIVLVVHLLPYLTTLLLREGFVFDGTRFEAPSATFAIERGLGVLFAVLQAVTAAVAYHALRTGRQGGPDALLQVFE
jgi:hypothetical protein